jgi:hypothetical protein
VISDILHHMLDKTYFHMASHPISTSDFTPSCHHFLVAADVISDQEPFSDEPTPDDQIEVVTVAGGSYKGSLNKAPAASSFL